MKNPQEKQVWHLIKWERMQIQISCSFIIPIKWLYILKEDIVIGEARSNRKLKRKIDETKQTIETWVLEQLTKLYNKKIL